MVPFSVDLRQVHLGLLRLLGRAHLVVADERFRVSRRFPAIGTLEALRKQSQFVHMAGDFAPGPTCGVQEERGGSPRQPG